MKRIITFLLVAMLPLMAFSQKNTVSGPGKKKQKMEQTNNGGKTNSGKTKKDNKQNTNKPQKLQSNTQSASQPTKPTTGSHNGYEWVDLGLSVKWATKNVGASSPSNYGDYYAWGETSTKSEYLDSNSKTYGKSMGNIGGNSSYDVARYRWGGNW